MQQNATVLGVSSEKFLRLAATTARLASMSPELVQQRVDDIMELYGCSLELARAAIADTARWVLSLLWVVGCAVRHCFLLNDKLQMLVIHAGY